MDVSTGSWFKYLSEQILVEGLDDIGLPKVIINDIRGNLPDPVSEKARMWVADAWKKITPGGAPEQVGAHWLSRGDTISEEVIWGVENWTNSILVDKELIKNLMSPESLGGLDPEESKHNISQMMEYIQWNAQLKKRVAKYDTLVGDYPKVLRKALKTLDKLLLEAEKKSLYPFNPKLLSRTEDVPSRTLIKRGYEELFDNKYQEFFQAMFSEYRSIFTALNEEPSFYDVMKKYRPDAIGRVKEKANSFLEDLEEEAKVIRSYKDGTYWYNLGVSKCDLAKERNFNCGDAFAGETENLPSDLTLIELRFKDPKKPEAKYFKSFVMVAYSSSEDSIYQVKGNKDGHGNLVPRKNTWPKIVDLINELGVTHILETGRHSDEENDFPAFLEHLADETGAELDSGAPAITELWAEAQGSLNELDEQDFDHIHFSWDEYDIDLEDNEVSVSFEGGSTFSIPLGWEGIYTNTGAGRRFVPDDDELRERIKPIPMNAWRSDIMSAAEEFLPSYIADGDVEAEYEIDSERNEIDFRLRVSTLQRYDINDVDEAPGAYENFIGELEREINDVHGVLKEKLRLVLLEQGHIEPSGWDDIRKEILITQEAGDFAPNFNIAGGDKEDPHEFVVTFIMNPNPPSGESVADTGVIFPKSFKEWNQNSVKQSDLEKVFDSALPPNVHYIQSTRALKKDSPALKAIAANLNASQEVAIEAGRKQTELPLGTKYKAPLPQVLDVNKFIAAMIGLTAPDRATADRTITLFPRFFITSQMKTEEAQSAYDLIKWMNNNADQIRTMIKDVVEARVEAYGVRQREARKIVDEDTIKATVQQIKDQAENFFLYDPADPRFNPHAFAKFVVAMWVQSNWPIFTPIEKMAAADVLEPINVAGMPPMIEPHLDDLPPQSNDFEKGRKPKRWEEYVKKVMAQMNARQTAGLSAFDYRWDRRQPLEISQPGEWQPGMPTPANESIEDQIDRIDKLLQEKDPSYDLRIYSVRLDCSIAKDRGGEMQETQTEIRGIEGVTTVRTIGDARRGLNQSWMATLEIKFELLGAVGRVKYRDRILVPGLMKVKGLTILRLSPMHRTNVRGSIRTVRESKKKELYEFAYTDSGTPPMVTPAVSIDGVLEDWVDGGVQIYDVPMDTTNMQYHVMVPTEELLPYISRIYRGTKTDFDGRYKYFIKDGATMPVYVALGQNGRVKVTGNEDYIWFAKRSGLKELPVFFSYQKQV